MSFEWSHRTQTPDRTWSSRHDQTSSSPVTPASVPQADLQEAAELMLNSVRCCVKYNRLKRLLLINVFLEIMTYLSGVVTHARKNTIVWDHSDSVTQDKLLKWQFSICESSLRVSFPVQPTRDKMLDLTRTWHTWWEHLCSISPSSSMPSNISPLPSLFLFVFRLCRERPFFAGPRSPPDKIRSW